MSKSKVLKLAKRLGANVVDDGGCIFVEAPKGQTWAVDDGRLHNLGSNPGWDEGIAGAWKDLFERMQDGLRDCPINGCKCS